MQAWSAASTPKRASWCGRQLLELAMCAAASTAPHGPAQPWAHGLCQWVVNAHTPQAAKDATIQEQAKRLEVQAAMLDEQDSKLRALQ